MNHYCDKCGQPVRKTAKRKTVKHTQRKGKKRNYAPVVFLAGCAVLIAGLVFVMIGG